MISNSCYILCYFFKEKNNNGTYYQRQSYGNFLYVRQILYFFLHMSNNYQQ